MDDADQERLTDILAMATANLSCLNDWEQHFIKDVNARYAQWGNDIKVTVKMWNILFRINEKCAAH
jgi:hypothetical protein